MPRRPRHGIVCSRRRRAVAPSVVKTVSAACASRARAAPAATGALVTAAAVLLGVVIGVQISLRWRPTVHATDQVLTDEKVVLAALGAQSKNKAPEQALGSRVRSPKPSTRGELVPGFGEYLDGAHTPSRVTDAMPFPLCLLETAR